MAGWAERIPPSYDLRSAGRPMEVSDQGDLGTCWAFASLTALSTSVPEELSGAFSADHMINTSSFGLPADAGGDYSISSAYLLAWQGPVWEKDDAYGDGRSPEGLEPVCHVQSIKILGEKDYQAIKRAVLTTGGVQSSLYLPLENAGDRAQFYREDTGALFYDGAREANHDVVIIGWDDAYPKENFSTQPSNDGAFLCMNSWGKEFGNEGCFYVSYEDSQIGRHNVSYAGIDRVDRYDRIYQTDLCGWTGQLGFSGPQAWFANVYEADEAGEVCAVGFYATAPDTEYRVYTAPIPEGKNGDEVLEALFSEKDPTPQAQGKLDEAGYYTIALKAEQRLKPGEQFAAVVEILSPGTTQPVAVEYKSGARMSNVDIGDGEGYISSDGVKWLRAEDMENCNVCLKAYGNTDP